MNRRTIRAASHTGEDRQIDPLQLHKAFAIATRGFSTYSLHPDDFVCDDTIKGGRTVNGRTGFFRHRGIAHFTIESLLELHPNPDRPIEILAAPSSIGCEAFGFAALGVRKGLGGKAGFNIDAFDCSERFTALARQGCYPIEMVRNMEESWRGILLDPDIVHDRFVNVRRAVKSRVRFLDHMFFQDFSPQKKYDVVMVNNLLMYLNDDEREQAMKVIVSTGAELLIVNTDDRVFSEMPPSLPYIHVKEHPVWADTPLAESAFLHTDYHIWARNKAAPEQHI